MCFSEKVDLKLNIWKTKIMASGPITSWKIDGKTVETVSDFILGGSKITADGDFSSVQASLVAQRLKRLLGMQETQVQSLGLEDPLDKEMATHSSMLAWRIPWTEELGRLHSPWGHKESDTTEQLLLST